MARLNDTRALTDRPMASGESQSISVEKIQNGFIVCESSCNPHTGEYKSTRHFTPAPPTVAQKSDQMSESSLQDTMDYLNEGRD